MSTLRRIFPLFTVLGLALLCAACAGKPQPVEGKPLTVVARTPLSTRVDAQAPAEATCTATPGTASPPTAEAIELRQAPPASTPSPAYTPTLEPRAWRTAPVIPTYVSQRMVEIYQMGLAMGNNPHAFSKVGDCQTMLPDFFGDLDKDRYDLGEYDYLQHVIDNFSGSFERNSRSVKNGMTASGAMATLWNSWKDCNVEETPLECEYRINQPSFAIISLGTNDANGLVPFEDTLRKVLETTLEHGIVPILVTKADNAEGDWSINETIYALAHEYEVPVWNFWRAVQPLPLRGLRSPEHLTYGNYTLTCDFSTAENLLYGYNARNLTGLQALDAVWRAVTGQPASGFIPTPVTFLP